MDEILSVINPATEKLVEEISIDGVAAIADKVQQARQAQPDWAGTPLTERIQAIKAFSNSLLEQADSLAAILTAETGKPITAENEPDIQGMKAPAGP